MSPPRVLVLDDEPHVLAAVRRLLREELDMDPVAVPEPVRALQLLECEPFHVFLSDLHMPGMNGVEVLTRAARLAPGTVRVLLTGRAERTDIAAAVNAAGIFRYVPKPWENGDLVAVVREAVEFAEATRRTADEHRNLRTAVASVGGVQRSLLPDGRIGLPNGEAACSFTALEHATGDYVDVARLEDGCVALLVGDVAGHGMDAAMFMLTARALLRSGLLEGGRIEDVVTRTNRFLCRDMAEGRFMTLFCGVYDPREGRLHYVNAGQTPPFVLHAARVYELARTSMPLGIMHDARYERAESVPLPAGATLFACTDGALEARSAKGEMLGLDRLLEVLQRHAALPPDELVDRVRADVAAFAAGFVDDDLALLAFRPTAEAQAVAAAVCD